jgi:NadR type nicotinamide-nucleotide adenylyltransferase
MAPLARGVARGRRSRSGRVTSARPLRVVLTGSECTGKTTLARRLADAYGAALLPEYSREYALQKHGALELADAEEIAHGQIAREDAVARSGARLVIQDTDLLSTVVYSTHYYGECAPWIADAARERRPDLYLLLEIDVPWIADDVRDRGHMREEMQRLFRDAVRASGASVAVIRGSWEDRFARAREAIDAVYNPTFNVTNTFRGGST